ncbi:hypothetical protein ACG92U_03430 [Leuconostoc citreum]
MMRYDNQMTANQLGIGIETLHDIVGSLKSRAVMGVQKWWALY